MQHYKVRSRHGVSNTHIDFMIAENRRRVWAMRDPSESPTSGQQHQQLNCGCYG